VNRPTTIPDTGFDVASGREWEDSFPLPKWFFQQKSWVVDPLRSDNAIFNYPLGLRLYGHLDYSVLEKVLQEIVRRHDVLRSVFTAQESLIQRVHVFKAPAIAHRDLSGVDPEAREGEVHTQAVREVMQPFNLSLDLLLRCVLFKLRENDHVLLLITHHLVFDDWSTGIMTGEIAALYTAWLQGTPSPLEQIAYRYGDFVRRQANKLQGRELETRLAFWRKTIVGGNDFHHVQLDYPRPDQSDSKGAYIVKSIPAALTALLQAVGRQERVSLFMTMLSGFHCLLHRYSKSEVIGVGSCAANRSQVQVENLIGRFGNDLVIRTSFAGDPTFREVIGRIREASLNAYTYQDLPFGEVVDALAHGHSSSRNPLFQVMFILKSAPRQPAEIPGITLKSFAVRPNTAKYDLNVWINVEGPLEVMFEYRSALFSPETMLRMMDDYTALLESAAADPEIRSSRM
jgi:hypothetical protein